MQGSVEIALCGFGRANCSWDWSVSKLPELSLCVQSQRKGSPRCLGGSIIATTMQMLNNFVLAGLGGKEQTVAEKGLCVRFLSGLLSSFLFARGFFLGIKCSIRILAHGIQMDRFWFLSEAVSHWESGKWKPASGGGFIIIPISKIVLRVYAVTMSNSAYYLFAEKKDFWRLHVSSGTQEAPRSGRYGKMWVTPPCYCSGICNSCIGGVFLNHTNILPIQARRLGSWSVWQT